MTEVTHTEFAEPTNLIRFKKDDAGNVYIQTKANGDWVNVVTEEVIGNTAATPLPFFDGTVKFTQLLGRV